MSELFGMSASTSVNISFSLTDVEGQGGVDDSSWGVGFYRIGELEKPYATIVKEPISATNSIFTYFLKYGYIRTNLFVSNIRLASVGAKVHLNTHPFELMLDPRASTYKEKSWIFTHNGTLPEIKNDLRFPTSIEPHGNTDSEYIFCYLMEQVREAYVRNGYLLSTEEKIDIIQRCADAVRAAYPRNLNFILSDGERLYAYYGDYELAGGLWYWTGLLEEEKLSLYDTHDGMTIQISSREQHSLGQQPAASHAFSLIAARPLTSDGWQPFKPHTLTVFERGSLVK